MLVALERLSASLLQLKGLKAYHRAYLVLVPSSIVYNWGPRFNIRLYLQVLDISFHGAME
jgi:hypothetical protein